MGRKHTHTVRKIVFAGIELTSQRVRDYMVPLSYRGDRLSTDKKKPMIPPKRFDIFPADWGMLRGCSEGLDASIFFFKL